MSVLISAAAVVFVFGLVIFVHEFGHFIVAKRMGVKVERFSFGLGPEAVGFQWGETRYCLAWIPLGGEVRMAGELDGDDDEPIMAKSPRDFFAQAWYRRLPIVLAGPAMNYVLSFALFSVLALAWGDPQLSKEPVIGGLMEGHPAAEAGLLAGDRVLDVAGEPVSTWVALVERVQNAPNTPVALTVRRGGETFPAVVTPRLDERTGAGLIGITPETLYVKVGALEALQRGAHQCWALSAFTVHYLVDKIVQREKPDLAGPLGIAQVISKATKAGAQDFIYLIALISVGIGLFNLFPIPMLDGGHAAFYIWEGVTRRPVTRKAMSVANTVGLSLLLGIFLFATYSDIQRMIPNKPQAESAEARP